MAFSKSRKGDRQQVNCLGASNLEEHWKTFSTLRREVQKTVQSFSKAVYNQKT
jgi:hypothetical protein